MCLKRTTCLLQPSRAKSHERQSKDFLVVTEAPFTHSDSSVAEPDPEQGHKPAQRHYRWPLFVIAGIILGILLAILWLSFEIRRLERIRQLNSPGGRLSP
jgi:hypothetical protein